jgi:hypothetical protein
MMPHYPGRRPDNTALMLHWQASFRNKSFEKVTLEYLSE